VPASSGKRTGERTSLGFDCSVLRLWIVKPPRCGPRLEPGWACKRWGAGPPLSAQGRCRAGARAGLERQHGITSREARHLQLPLATTQPVDGARLISGYSAVRLRGGLLAGSSVVRAPILYIGNQSPVRSRPGLRRSRPTGRAPGFYPGVKGFETSGRHERRWRNRRARFPSKETAPGSSPGRRTHAPLEERDNSPGPQPGDCGFKSRTEHGPIVYRLGSGTFNSGNGVRPPVGLLRGSQVRYGAGPITQRCAGSNPVPATKIHHIPVSPNGRARGC
jgi:hypothetical protein